VATLDQALLGTIALTGFSVAFVHAMMPTHWLPFVLAGRGQGWSHARTMAITAVAGGGHVLFTIALGVLVAWLGITIDRWTGSVFPWIAAAILLLFGTYYWFRGGHAHHHFTPAAHRGEHDHGTDHDHSHDAHHDHVHHDQANRLVPVATRVALRGDTAVILALIAALTFSPCEGFFPVFIVGARYGWWGFALLCLILAVATLGGMMLLTWLTLRGVQHLELDALDRYEGRILGGMLIALGLAVVILET
jgi:nickel/cobalt exporter